MSGSAEWKHKFTKTHYFIGLPLGVWFLEISPNEMNSLNLCCFRFCVVVWVKCYVYGLYFGRFFYTVWLSVFFFLNMVVHVHCSPSKTNFLCVQHHPSGLVLQIGMITNIWFLDVLGGFNLYDLFVVGWYFGVLWWKFKNETLTQQLDSILCEK